MSNITNAGDIPVQISNLGANAVAAFQAGLGSLSSGAVGFSTSTLDSIKTATGDATTQLSGLATGLAQSTEAAAAAANNIATTLQGDIGALMLNGSKFGTALTAGWAAADQAVSSLSSLSGDQLTGLILDPVGTLTKNAVGAVTDIANGAIDGAKALVGDAKAQLDSLGKAAQSAINFVETTLSGLVAGVQKAAGFTNTVNRATVDAAVTRIIGADKISTPTFELPSIESLGISADISQAKSILSRAQSVASNLYGQATNAANNAVSAVSSIGNFLK